MIESSEFPLVEVVCSEKVRNRARGREFAILAPFKYVRLPRKGSHNPHALYAIVRLNDVKMMKTKIIKRSPRMALARNELVRKPVSSIALSVAIVRAQQGPI